jgi:hypothetical protein
VEATQTLISALASFVVDKDVLKFNGFVTYFLQIGAVLAGVRALLPTTPVKIDLSRPIFILNFDLAAQSSFYGKCEALNNFRDLDNTPDGQGDRILVCYKDLSGNLDVVEELVGLGKQNHELIPTTHPPVGGVIPSTRWISEWCAHRWHFGCPSPAGDQFLTAPIAFKRDRLSSLMWTLRERYGYEPESEWGSREPKQFSMRYWDNDQHTSCFVCEFFESKCASDMEKTKAVMGLSAGSKTLNIIRVKNTTHETVTNVHIHMDFLGRSGKIVEKVAKVEDMDVVINTFGYARVHVCSLPPQSSRFLVVERSGRPLKSENIYLESPLMTKFSVKALRWIAAVSLLLTSSIAVVTWASTTLSVTQ